MLSPWNVRMNFGITARRHLAQHLNMLLQLTFAPDPSTIAKSKQNQKNENENHLSDRQNDDEDDVQGSNSLVFVAWTLRPLHSFKSNEWIQVESLFDTTELITVIQKHTSSSSGDGATATGRCLGRPDKRTGNDQNKKRHSAKGEHFSIIKI